MRQIVTHAYSQVPFYNQLYKKNNVDPRDIINAPSINKFPIITKDEIVKTSLELRTSRSTDVNACITKTTSGSTGIPVTVLQDPNSAAYLDGLHVRRLLSYGAKPWHRLARIVTDPKAIGLSSSLTDKGGLWGSIRSKKIARISLATDIRGHIEFYSRWKPDIIVGPRSYFRGLIQGIEEFGGSLSLKLAITWGEVLEDSTRRLISESFGAEVFDGYGCTEVAPVGGLAWECPSHYAYHINIDSVVLEFLRDGEAVPFGRPGTVCATSLFSTATPMIRYLLGDIATPLGDDCPCGRGLPLLKNIEGRTVDFIITPDGQYISPYTIMYTLQDVEGVMQYKVIQRKDYSIELQVKTLEEHSEPILQRLRQRCTLLFGEIPVTIRPVDGIDSPKGHKFRPVESHVSR